MTETHDTAKGICRRDAAHSHLKARRAALVLRVQRALLDQQAATADDVRHSVQCPDGVSPKAFGAVPTDLVRAGIIAAATFQKSNRPTAHAQPVTVWRIIDRTAAAAWLRQHPEPAEPEMSKGTAT